MVVMMMMRRHLGCGRLAFLFTALIAVHISISSSALPAFSDDLPVLRVPSCSSERGFAEFGNFSVSNTLPGKEAPRAAQATNGRICWSSLGLHILETAQEKHIFSPYTGCESPVFVKSDVLEAFLAPVIQLSDNPQWYFELDVSPSGVMWGGLSNNSLGNASTCVAEKCTSGQLPCSGMANFAHGMHAAAKNFSHAYQTSLFVPFEIFAKPFRLKNDKPWKTWRANFYRYDYPSGPNKTFQNYELSAWSPTFSPSFHVPSRFGHLIMV